MSQQGECNLWSLKKLTTAYLFQIAQEFHSQIFKFCWDIQGSHLISCFSVSLIIDQSECLISCFLYTELTLFCTELHEHCIYLNQSELSDFSMYIIKLEKNILTCYKVNTRMDNIQHSSSPKSKMVSTYQSRCMCCILETNLTRKFATDLSLQIFFIHYISR